MMNDERKLDELEFALRDPDLEVDRYQDLVRRIYEALEESPVLDGETLPDLVRQLVEDLRKARDEAKKESAKRRVPVRKRAESKAVLP